MDQIEGATVEGVMFWVCSGGLASGISSELAARDEEKFPVSDKKEEWL